MSAVSAVAVIVTIRTRASSRAFDPTLMMFVAKSGDSGDSNGARELIGGQVDRELNRI